jgi:hypothetical protein
MSQAQRLVMHAAESPENIQQAKLAAETVIRSFYAEVGWQVAVTWAVGRPGFGCGLCDYREQCQRWRP